MITVQTILICQQTIAGIRFSILGFTFFSVSDGYAVVCGRDL